MYQRLLWQCLAAVAAIVLMASGGSTSTPEATGTDESEIAGDARRLAARLLDVSLSKHRPPLTSDAEQRRSSRFEQSTMTR